MKNNTKWVVVLNERPVVLPPRAPTVLEGPFHSKEEADSYAEYYSSKEWAINVCELKAPLLDEHEDPISMGWVGHNGLP